MKSNIIIDRNIPFQISIDPNKVVAIRPYSPGFRENQDLASLICLEGGHSFRTRLTFEQAVNIIVKALEGATGTIKYERT